MKRTEAIIDSMTRRERNDHKFIDASRKTRIAGGSGSTIAEVNQLLRQYEQMKKMMSQMNRGGLLSKLAGKAMGGLAGGLGGLLGGGGMRRTGGLLGGGGSGNNFDNDYEETKDNLSKKLKEKEEAQEKTKMSSE